MFVNKNNQKGRSLVEVLAVLTIIAMLGASVIKVIGSIYAMLKENMATTEIKEIQKTISGVYNFSGNYDVLFQDDAYKVLCETDKSLPSQMCLKSGTSYRLRHRLSGNITINKNTDGSGYVVSFGELNKKNCVAFTQIDWLSRKKTHIYQLDINGAEVAYFPKKNDKGFPISTSTAFSSCNSNSNTISWYFY